MKQMKPFRQVPKWEWPEDHAKKLVCEVVQLWTSADFLVQVVKEKHGVFRLAITRTQLDFRKRQGRQLADGITWDELQEIKDAVGFEDHDAIEFYPRKSDVVNVANVRHLWVIPEAHGFIFKSLFDISSRRRPLRRFFK